jgi:murein endopeptidase
VKRKSCYPVRRSSLIWSIAFSILLVSEFLGAGVGAGQKAQETPIEVRSPRRKIANSEAKGDELTVPLAGTTVSNRRAPPPDFPPCSPESPPLTVPERGDGLKHGSTTDKDPSIEFCSIWNPDFPANGHRCCGPHPKSRKRGRNRGNLCPASRFKVNFCDERTPEQIRYREQVSQGQVGDLLAFLTTEVSKRREQAFCAVNNGFLAWGREVLPTSSNRLALRSPDRCANFGTDEMASLIEWLGRGLAQEYSAPEYSGVKLIVGDVTGPRGGCLAGRSGRRGHASHTNGQDADLGFLWVKSGKNSPVDFHREFPLPPNWALLKRIFDNPFACVRVVFLDKKLIRKLSRAYSRDPDWQRLSRYIRHVPGHNNHFHIRIGEEPGPPGCGPGVIEDWELEEDTESKESLFDLQ